MERWNFFNYTKNAENPGGDYWEFLDATAETLKKDDIDLLEIDKIIREISNQDLKLKMKQKLFELSMENGIFAIGVESSLGIFSNDEVKLLLQNELNIKLNKQVFTQENIRYNISNIILFIRMLEKAKDNNWEYLIVKNILDMIKDYSDKAYLVSIVENYKDNLGIYSSLINDYHSYFPEVYKNFLKMKQDKNYLYNKSLQFMDENVDIDIGIDPRISIGPEIEANNDYSFKLDLSNQIGFEEYYPHDDATVPNGREVSLTRPFHNKREDVAKFCGLCEAMKDIGYYYNEESYNTSGQINLGLDYLDTKEAILNFYEIYGNCEELLYYICNQEGQLFRQDVFSSSRIKPISEIIGNRILGEELSRKDIIKLFNSQSFYGDGAIKGLQYKKNSVCLRGTSEKDYRLEFRIPNGGCNYEVWIDNIRLFGKMMEVAKKLADMMKKDYLSSEEEDLLRFKISLQDSSLSLEEKLDILMNLLFKDKNIKQIYKNRYISTVKKIKETNSKKYEDIYGFSEPSFDEVEFVGEYQSRLGLDYDGDGVLEYDPLYGIVEHHTKK